MATKTKEPPAGSKYPYALVAIRDVDKYRKGDIIGDDAEITRLLKVAGKSDFTKVAKS